MKEINRIGIGIADCKYCDRLIKENESLRIALQNYTTFNVEMPYDLKIKELEQENKELKQKLGELEQHNYEHEEKFLELNLKNYANVLKLEKIKEKWQEFKKLSPLEISFNSKIVYELNKIIEE